MSFPAALLDLMPSTIKVSTRTTHSNYGEPSFATSTSSYRARIVEKPGYLRDGTGEEISYSHVVWVASTGAVSITASDRVTLPGGVVRPVLAVERYPDEDGPHHVKVHLGY
jgi:hypothetical protein